MTGQKASADEVDRMIETGESERIFQRAILEQGRGHVSLHSFIHRRIVASTSVRLMTALQLNCMQKDDPEVCLHQF